MNSSLELLKASLAKRGIKSGAISPQAEEICKLIDHFNEQHWHDRNSYGAEIKRLKSRIAKLEGPSE